MCLLSCQQVQVDSLLQDIPKPTKILTYHVVSGKVMAADVVKLKSATMLKVQL